MKKEIDKSSWVQKNAVKIYGSLRLIASGFMFASANALPSDNNSPMEFGKMFSATIVAGTALYFLAKKKVDPKKIATKAANILTEDKPFKVGHLYEEHSDFEVLQKTTPLHLARSTAFLFGALNKFISERQDECITHFFNAGANLLIGNGREALTEAGLALIKLNEVLITTCSVFGYSLINNAEKSDQKDIEQKLDSSQKLFYGADGIAICSVMHDTSLALASVCFIASSYMMKHIKQSKDIDKTDVIELITETLKGRKKIYGIEPSPEKIDEATKTLSRFYKGDIRGKLEAAIEEITTNTKQTSIS